MMEIFKVIAHLLSTLVRASGPGGICAVLAESLLLKHQLLVLSRSRKRAPRLTPWDRLVFGIGAFLWSADLFRCESIVLRSYWVMVVMDLFIRRIVGFSVEPADLDGVAVCRMFNQAISGKPLPKHLSTDHDPLFRFHRWRANLRVLEIEEIKTVPFVPCSHPFIERLIGTIRREYLDMSCSGTA